MTYRSAIQHQDYLGVPLPDEAHPHRGVWLRSES